MAYSSFFKPVNGDDDVLVAAADENQNQNTPADNGETQTPSTTSTMTSSVTEARLRQLERENMHLREQVNKHSRGKNGRVIRQIGKKPREGGQDTLNHGVILPKVEEIFYDEKFWTNNWEIYNTEENSICTRVSMREWTQKNKGEPLYKMFTGNEYAHYALWKEFFKLDETDERRVKFHEIWDQADQEMKLSDKVMRRKRKRDGDKPNSSVAEPPPLPSPDT
eukprot:scaffold124326_cov81-Cyclotella_meneghiniana.AAC.1